MIRIIVIGDVHDYRERLDPALDLVSGVDADLALLVGDIALDPPWNEPARRLLRQAHDDSFRAIVAAVHDACRCPVAFVPGNHDLEDPARDVVGHNLDGKVDRVGGLRVAGLGGAGPDIFGFPYEWSEREAAARLARIEQLSGAQRLDVLLSHAPPADTPLDITVKGDHVGSQAVGDTLVRLAPRLFVCGHIHEAWGVHVVNGVPCLNAGALGEPYGQVIIWVVDWEEGPRRIVSIRDIDVGSPVRREWWPPQG